MVMVVEDAPALLLAQIVSVVGSAVALGEPQIVPLLYPKKNPPRGEPLIHHEETSPPVLTG